MAKITNTGDGDAKRKYYTTIIMGKMGTLCLILVKK